MINCYSDFNMYMYVCVCVCVSGRSLTFCQKLKKKVFFLGGQSKSTKKVGKLVCNAIQNVLFMAT